MVIKKIFAFLMYTALVLPLISCGPEMGDQLAAGGIIGTGENGTDITLDPAGINGLLQNSKIVSVGTITALDGVTVNGIKYETSDALIIRDGNEIENTPDSLALGMVVEVLGSVNSERTTGIAERVTFDDIVDGPLSKVDDAAKTFVILGKTVKVSTDTVFDLFPPDMQGGFPELAIGAIYEVSGFIDSDGSVIATRVEQREKASLLELTGDVWLLNPDDKTFAIGAILIDFSDATLKKFGEETLSNGDFVKVKGRISEANADTFFAKEVKLKTPKHKEMSDKDEYEVEGVIASVTGLTLKLLSGDGTVKVIFGSFTKFEHGLMKDLKAGLKTEIEGVMINGDLEAKKISIKQKGRKNEADDDKESPVHAPGI